MRGGCGRGRSDGCGQEGAKRGDGQVTNGRLDLNVWY